MIGGFPGSSDSKEFAGNAGNPGSTLRLGTSPGEGNGDPYSPLENPMKEPGLQSMGSQRVRNDWAASKVYAIFVFSFYFIQLESIYNVVLI